MTSRVIAFVGGMWQRRSDCGQGYDDRNDISYDLTTADILIHPAPPTINKKRAFDDIP